MLDANFANSANFWGIDRGKLAELAKLAPTDKVNCQFAPRSPAVSIASNKTASTQGGTRFQGKDTVGKLVVTIGVGDQQGRQFEDLEVTVDTGSTFTAVPRALLQRLGVPVRRSARSRLADGSSVPVALGWALIRLEGQVFPAQVIFAEEDQSSVLGMVTLETALLAVDPVGQRLAPVEAERL